MPYNPSCRTQDDVLSVCVLKVTPDIRIVHVNTHTVVCHAIVNMQSQGLLVVMGPPVIIPKCQKIIGKAPFDPFFIYIFKKKSIYALTVV